MDITLHNNLLGLIKQNPALYDRNDENFDNEAVKNSLWHQISSALNLSVQECKAKYKYKLAKFGKIKKLLEDGFKISPNQFNFLKKNLFLTTAYFDNSLLQSNEISNTNDLTYEYFSDDDEFDDSVELGNSVNLQLDIVDCLVFSNDGKFETIEEIKRSDLQPTMSHGYALDKEFLVDCEQSSSTSSENHKRMLEADNDQILPPLKKARLFPAETNYKFTTIDLPHEQLLKRNGPIYVNSIEKKNEQSPLKREKQVDYTFGKYVAEALMCYSPMSKAKARVDIDKVLANSNLNMKQ